MNFMPSLGGLFHSNQSVIDSLERGDLVKFQRIGYTHFAVYIGGERVIHRSGPPGTQKSKNTAHIREDHLDDVIKGSTLERINVKGNNILHVLGATPITSPFSRGEIVRRAKSRLGERGYNLIFNNCEHFAYWAAYDKHISFQTGGLFSPPFLNM